MGLLDDVRVIDAADGFGELCGRVLADLGAEVLRLEVGGATSPPVARSLSFVYRNANKRLLRVDPASRADRAELESLLAGADLVIESPTTAALGNLYPDLAPGPLLARHRHLVITSITPFGLTGPYRSFAATELVLQALGGTLYRAGSAVRPPCAAPGSFASDVAGATAALGSLLALWQSRNSGVGQHLDASAIEALAHLTDWALPLWSALRTDQQRAGAPLYPLFRCADGLVRLVLPMTARDWQSLLRWVDAAELAHLEPTSPSLPPADRDLVIGAVARFVEARTRLELTQAAMAAGVAVAPVLLPGEVLTTEHARSRDTAVELDLPDGRRGLAPSGFFSVDGARAGIRRPPVAATSRPQWPARSQPRSGTWQAPLSGIRVLDFGIGGVGPECGRVLAEWGADVIKVESSRRPDFQRRVLGGDMNPTFASSSRSKRCFDVDLRTDEGRALMQRLVTRIDIVVENMASGAMGRLGIGFDQLHAINPALIMVSSQLLGDRGAWSDWKGYGPSARAIGGLTWLWDHADVGTREGVSTIHPDHFAGRLLALGAVAALFARQRDGAGRHVDLAQFEVVTGLLGDLFLAESVAPGSIGPIGNTSSAGAPWGVYRCRDDGPAQSWVAICVRDDDEWQRLCKVLAQPGWTEDAGFHTGEGRLERRDELDAHIGHWTAARDARDVMQQLQAAGIPAGVALHPRTQVDDPHYVARGFVRPLDQPGCGMLLVDGPAFRSARLGDVDIRPAPMPGAHTREVCAELLGLDDAEIDRLVAQGVLSLG